MFYPKNVVAAVPLGHCGDSCLLPVDTPIDPHWNDEESSLKAVARKILFSAAKQPRRLRKKPARGNAQALEEIEPDKTSEVPYERVDLYLAAKKWYMAAAVARHLVKADPGNPAAWINPACSIPRAENIEQAILLKGVICIRRVP